VTFAHLWETNRIGTSAALMRRSVFERLGGFNEAMWTVEDYNLWLRVAATGGRILTYPEALTEYSRGNGLSSHAENMLTGQLRNIAEIGNEFGISITQLRRKRRQIYAEIGRMAFHQRKMNLARKLFARAFLMEPTANRAFWLCASFCPQVMLDWRRQRAQIIRP